MKKLKMLLGWIPMSQSHMIRHGLYRPVMREDIIAEARSWIDTPWHHQASVKGIGCDCAGLVRGIGNVLGIMDLNEETIEAKEFIGYGRAPEPKRLIKALNRFMNRIDVKKIQPADVLLFKLPEPQHLAILTDQGTIIHALCKVGKVSEMILNANWQDLIVGAWKYKNI